MKKQSTQPKTLNDIKDLITPFNTNGEKIIINNQLNSYRATEVLLRAANNSLTPEDKIYIIKEIISNSYFNYAIPVMGVKFDFSPFLKKYWVEIKPFGDTPELRRFHAIDISSLQTYLSEYYKPDENEPDPEVEFTIIELPKELPDYETETIINTKIYRKINLY
jgi:hypothetical protein